MPGVEVKLIKTHDDAKLPVRNHGNREINAYEERVMEVENERLQNEKPEMYAHGMRIGFPMEQDADGQLTNRVMGTGDTGYDIFAVEDTVIPAKGSNIVGTGIELAYISPGYWFRIEARSGLGFKYGIIPHFGIIDNNYQGNLGIKLYNLSDIDYGVKKGDRIAQIVFYPVVDSKISWTTEKIETIRGANGFGSSGK